MRLLSIALLWALALTVRAASPPSITLKWTAVTTDATGKPLPAGSAVSYNVYGSHALLGTFVLATNTTALTVTRTNVDEGNDCYYVTAVLNGVESEPTDVLCIDVEPPVAIKPAKPAGFLATQD